MARALPRTEQEWRAYLQQYSADVLDGGEDDELWSVTAEQRAAGWLGREGASADDLAALEQRAGSALPPSYRAFLAVTDGWSFLSHAVRTLRPAARVVPLVEEDLHLVELYEDGEDPWPPDGVLRRCLLVSDDEDAARVVLDPGDVDDAGEWAAWWYASWAPGFTRHDSFAALVEKERSSFEFVRAGDGRPVRPQDLDVEVDEAVLRARAGALDEAAAWLDEARERGSVRARLLRAVLAGARGDWQRVDTSDLVEDGHPALGEAVLEAEVLPLLLHAQRAAGGPRDLDLPQYLLRRHGGDAGEGLARALVRQARGEAPPVLPDDVALHGALDACRAAARDGQDAWPLLQEALRAWPASPLRLLPVAVVVDPVLGPLLAAHVHEALAAAGA